MEVFDKIVFECVMEVDEERMRFEVEVVEFIKFGDEGSDRYGFVVKFNCFIRCFFNDLIKIYLCFKIERLNMKFWGLCCFYRKKILYDIFL